MATGSVMARPTPAYTTDRAARGLTGSPLGTDCGTFCIEQPERSSTAIVRVPVLVVGPVLSIILNTSSLTTKTDAIYGHY